MKITLRFVPILLLYMLAGCINDGPPTYEKKLNGPYYLDAIDDYKEIDLLPVN